MDNQQILETVSYTHLVQKQARQMQGMFEGMRGMFGK